LTHQITNQYQSIHMKTMRIQTNFSLTILLSFTLLTAALTMVGCKKGQEDPLLSLRSRKARLAGRWTLTEAVYYKNGEKLNIGKNNELVENGKVLTCAWSITIDKDGSVAELITTSGEGERWSFDRFGTWTFLDKHEEYKNKEVVQFEYTRQEKSGYTQNGFYPTDVNLTRTYQKAKVIGLHNNKLHMQFKKCDLYDSADLTFERVKSGFHPLAAVYVFLLILSPKG
jgi:hypothetical protein